MALCQAGNVLFIAIESTVSLGLPPPFPLLNLPARIAFDLFTAAAMVTAVSLHPRRLPGAGLISLGAWAWAGGLVTLGVLGHLTALWWWTQGSMIAMAASALRC